MQAKESLRDGGHVRGTVDCQTNPVSEFAMIALFRRGHSPKLTR
jgi:hypothetical protein